METWTLRKTRAQNITTWGTRSFTVPLAPSCVDTKPTQYTYQYGSDTARQEWTGGEGSWGGGGGGGGGRGVLAAVPPPPPHWTC